MSVFSILNQRGFVKEPIAHVSKYFVHTTFWSLPLQTKWQPVFLWVFLQYINRHCIVFQRFSMAKCCSHKSLDLKSIRGDTRDNLIWSVITVNVLLLMFKGGYSLLKPNKQEWTEAEGESNINCHSLNSFVRGFVSSSARFAEFFIVHVEAAPLACPQTLI